MSVKGVASPDLGPAQTITTALRSVVPAAGAASMVAVPGPAHGLGPRS